MRFLLVVVFLGACSVGGTPTPPLSTQTPGQSIKAQTCITPLTSKGVNVRQGPSRNTAILDVLEPYSQTITLSLENDWYSVMVGSEIGYVYRSVVVPTPCIEQTVVPTATAIDCFQQIPGSDSPKIYLKGRLSWATDGLGITILTEEKIHALYRLLHDKFVNAEYLGSLYIQIAETYPELKAAMDVGPEVDGAFGMAALVDGCSLAGVNILNVTTRVPAIVIVVSPSGPSWTFETLVHELMHSLGADHNSWENNAYFWGFIANYAYRSKCDQSIFDEGYAESTICQEIQHILYDR